MFSGTYQHSLDSKGRIIIPARFREELGSKFVLTKGLDHCLFIYPAQEWAIFREKLKTVPLSSKEGRAFTRYFFSSAVECDMDKQGRLVIPSVLREHAKIDKELVTIGVNERVEVWSKAEWDDYNMSPEMDSDAIAIKMEDLRI